MFRRRWGAVIAFVMVAMPVTATLGTGNDTAQRRPSAGGCPSIPGSAKARPGGILKALPADARAWPIAGPEQNTARLALLSASAPDARGNSSVSVSVSCGDALASTAASMAVSASTPASAASDIKAMPARGADDEIETDLRGKLLNGLAGLAALFGITALLLVVLAAWQAAKRGGLRVTSYWGGFGGSGTGWHTSPATASLLCAAFLGCSSALLVMELLQSIDKHSLAKPPSPAASAAGKH